MNDKQIIADFKHLIADHEECYEVVVQCSGRSEYIEKMIESLKATLDLINRQKADIKKLTSGKCVYLSDDETTEYCVEGPCPNYRPKHKSKSKHTKSLQKK